MNTSKHKISLTTRQKNHYDDAVANKRGVQLKFLKAAIADMIKSCGIFLLLAAIPALIAAATPAVAKVAELGAVGTAAGMALKKATGQGYKEKKQGKGLRLPVFVVQRERLKDTRNGLLVEKPVVPMSNFDLIDAAKALAIKKLQRGLYERSVADTSQLH